jgi:hypothetical protein
MSGPDRRALRRAAIEALRGDPEVIVIQRRAGADQPGEWTISTAGHNTRHTRYGLDAEIMLSVLMRQQERDMP